ncbi:hypothetical protein ScPMuIL_014715 [Solemya velum]
MLLVIELAIREVENSTIMEHLQDQVLDLSDELELRKIHQADLDRSTDRLIQKQHAIDDIEDWKDAQKEKDKIEERYLRLQETMRSLQEEIHSVNFSKSRLNEIERNSLNSKPVTPKKKSRVQIHESPAKSRSPTRVRTSRH